ncbi:holin [Peribacillus saganii]|uniref:Holin n=1 Tax=Peribacillus saganii TaxID=2303992 RepID=A0A372LQ54_9BACI|nr:phage holin family protein [Peribacillus saganii]RFU70349.1 holin [Peribacillus saganii]
MDLQLVHSYLFGSVKYIDLLLVLMVVDLVMGTLKAIKNGRLRSLTLYLGYARKIGTFCVIIVANIIDIILDLNGIVAYGTVLFYGYYEILSILENCGQLGMKIPPIIADKLQVLQPTEKKVDDKNEN